MEFYFWEEFKELIPIYVPLLPKDFELIKNNGFKSFPERFFQYKRLNLIFDLDYAVKVCSDSENFPKKTAESFLIKFLYPRTALKQFRDKNHQFSILEGANIPAFNKAIVGYLELADKISLK